MNNVQQDVRVAIVGSGFAGLGMAIRLREAGIEDFVVLEKADDVGGTWRDNRYPGCACDVPSHLYSFSFAPNPEWTSTFSPQPEIWDYLRGCARALRGHARTSASATSCSTRRGTRTPSAGDWRPRAATLTAQALVLGTGAAQRAVDPRPAGPRALRGDDLPLGHVGPRPRPRRRARGCRSAPAPRRSSSSRRSSRGSGACTSSSARRRGSCRARTAPLKGWERRAVPRAAGRPAAHARGHLLGARELRARLPPPARHALGPAPRAAPPAPPGPRPRAAAQAHARPTAWAASAS